MFAVETIYILLAFTRLPCLVFQGHHLNLKAISVSTYNSIEKDRETDRETDREISDR